jgi:tetratricopeptide (TPR) repeat protein
MASALLTGLVFAQLVSPAVYAELAAAAAASPRPAICTPGVRGPRTQRQTFWDRAKTPRLQDYCDALARGYARVGRSPAAALQAADLADQALPGQAGTQALRGRALLRLGRVAEAWAAFSSARALDRRSLDVPSTLHDFAAAAAWSGHRVEAVQAYRALVVRAALMPGASERQRVYVEAAVWVMAAEPASLDEAIGYLTEARRQSTVPGWQGLVLGALALALDRQGHPEQARGVAAEAAGPWALAAWLLPERDDAEAEASSRRIVQQLVTDAALPVLPPGELHAIVAVLAEEVDRDLAIEQWTAYLEVQRDLPPSHAEHARAKLESLRGPRQQRRPR